MAITIPRTPLVDDDGSGTTGTILNNAWQSSLYDAIDVALAQVPAAGGSSAHAMLSATHTDTVPAALVAGDVLIVGAGGALTRLPKGTTGQQLVMGASLPAWGGLTFTPVAFNAANFTASGTMTWTVEAADVLVHKYAISGSMCIYSFDIYNSVTAGVASSMLKIKLPAVLVPVVNFVYAGLWLNATGQPGSFGVINVRSEAGQLLLELYCDSTMTKSWTLTSNQRVAGSLFFEIVPF